jgi:excisionase family DNA binding protein
MKTVKEIAEELRVSERTIQRAITAGLLEAVKVGPRVVRIPDAAISQYARPFRLAVAPTGGP